MIKTLAAIFGLFTTLAVVGTLTPAGQAMLGLKPQQQAAPVTAISDTPASVPDPAPIAAPQPHLVQQPVSTARPVPAARPAARAQARPAPAPPQAQGAGGLSNIANILLNLPQVLDQTHVGPAPGGGSWSESKGDEPHKWRKKHEDTRRDQGSDEGDGTH